MTRGTVYRPRGPLDLVRTVGGLARGPHDPAIHIDRSGPHPTVWLARRSSHGPVTLALRTTGWGTSTEVHATAWATKTNAAGAEEALADVPALCGANDDLTGFEPEKHPVIAQAVRRHPGLRLTRGGSLFETFAGVVLEQKVTSLQAYRAWRILVTRHGDPAPGPTPRPLYVPPNSDGWRGIPSWSWHTAGVEPPQSRTIANAAIRGERIVRAIETAPAGAEQDRILTSLPGVGSWTAAETRIRALGDPDAVSLGDYHLPHIVGYALTGIRVEDPEMLTLLEPWAGHRQRVIRLILAHGPREPRRGPRLAPEDHRAR